MSDDAGNHGSTARALVTGARGFVGRHLAHALHAAGQTVIGLDRPPADARPDPAWLCHHRDLGQATPGAVADLAALIDAEHVAAIYHLAGQSSAGASFGDPAGTVRANLLGTLEVLEALRLLQADGRPVPRLLCVGSAEEYGAAAGADRPCREVDPVLPVSPYGTTKAAATQLCVQYHRSFGVPVIAVRAFSHTGPGQDRRFVFPSFAAQLVAIERGRHEPVIRTGDLSPRRDYLDVRDVVLAYEALVARGEPGRVYNVCSGSGLTIRQGLDILLGLSSVAVRVETDPARLRPADIPCLVGDPAALVAATGWRPRYDFDTTLRDLLEAARRDTA